MASKAPTHRLTGLALSEVAFCVDGDNPKAKIALMKRRPSTDEVPVPAEDVEALKKSHEDMVKTNEELAKRLVEMEEREGLAKSLDFCKANGLAETLAPHLREVQKKVPAASYEAVTAELTRLQKAASATAELTKRIGSVGKTTESDAQVRLDTLVKQEIAKGHTPAEAATRVFTANPDLYAEVAYAGR